MQSFVWATPLELARSNGVENRAKTERSVGRGRRGHRLIPGYEVLDVVDPRLGPGDCLRRRQPHLVDLLPSVGTHLLRSVLRMTEDSPERRSPTVSRSDSASRVISASPQAVYGALSDPDALVAWLPPPGMTGSFDYFDLRAGGSYRLVLIYSEQPTNGGKTSADSDVVEARFIEVIPNERIVQAIDFVSDDPEMAGTMTMTWTSAALGETTRVDVVAANVPTGISPDDHAEGLRSSLSNLARHLES